MEITRLSNIASTSDGPACGKRPAEDGLTSTPGNELTYSPIVKKPRIEEENLCTACQHVNFVGLFDGTYKGHQILPTVRQALCNVDCLLCQLVITSLKDFSEREENSPKFEVCQDASDIIAKAPSALNCDLRVSLKWRPTPSDLYLKASAVCCSRQICIWLYDTKPSRSRERPQRQPVLLSSLDSTTFRRVIKSSDQPCAMVRRSIPERFYPGALRRWLDQSLTRSKTSRKRGMIDQRGSQSDPQDSGHFRLLDVHSGQIITSEKEDDYVALSYIWGKDMVAYTQKRTSTDREQLSMEDLPLTIRDAASLVAAIGERYLWVDAICIKQDDAEDQHANIAQIGSIYQQALLTIVATEGEGANAGLSRLRDSGRTPERPLTLYTAQGPVSLLPGRCSLEAALASTNWSARGWTMQERLLSKTCVFFTVDEVLFTSGAFEAREAYEIIEVTRRSDENDRRASRATRRRQRDFDRLLSGSGSDLPMYYDIVLQFTAKELSHEGDRLDAFTGILNSMHSRNKMNVAQDKIIALAGFHKRFFSLCLLWTFASGNVPTRMKVTTRNTRLLPSWSWAGWEGTCKFPHRSITIHYFLQILDAANVFLLPIDPSYLHEPPKDARIPVSRPLRTVLHLWTLAMDCELIPRDIDRPMAGFDIQIPLSIQVCENPGILGDFLVAPPTKSRLRDPIS